MTPTHPAPKLFNLKEFTDHRGTLAVLEIARLVGMDFKRIFVVQKVPKGLNRGEHGHRKCHQVLICVSGSVEVSIDDGMKVTKYLLDQPSLALHIPPWYWSGQTYLDDKSILVVLASDEFDALDYIDEYEEFKTSFLNRSKS